MIAILERAMVNPRASHIANCEINGCIYTHIYEITIKLALLCDRAGKMDDQQHPY